MTRAFPDYYRSPCCLAALTPREDGLHCTACDAVFPIAGDIPVLLPRPQDALPQKPDTQA